MCAQITTTANAVVEVGQSRMPEILQRDDYHAWLDPKLHFPWECYMSCRQVEQPVSGNLNLLLSHPGMENRTDFFAQHFATPRPPLVGVARPT